jgi:integrase
VRFTRQSVAELKIPAGKPYVIVWDESLPGFGVRVNPTNKQWVVQYRAGGKSRRETIGRVDRISLDDARKRARASLAKASLGADPQAEKAQERAKASITLGAVAERYLKSAKQRQRATTFDDTERYLTRHWAPLRPMPLHKITRANVAVRLGEIVDEHGPFSANRARATLSTMFGWAMGEGLVDANPVLGTNKPAEDVSRDHVLLDAELVAIWRACRDDDYGRIVRLLILTGQRREEVGAIGRHEVDFDGALWLLPKERSKNRREHEIPLSPQAVEILRSIPAREGRALLFGMGKGGYSGWTLAKEALERRIAEAGAQVRPWRLHDLRRTVATGMAERLGVLPHVVEAVLNHVSGHKSGVAGIYNRATYRAEKRQALDAWAEHVLRLVDAGGPAT